MDGEQRWEETEGAGRAHTQISIHIVFCSNPFSVLLLFPFPKPSTFLSSFASPCYFFPHLVLAVLSSQNSVACTQEKTQGHLGKAVAQSIPSALNRTQLAAFLYSSSHPPAHLPLSSFSASLNSSPPPLLPPLHHLSLCCFLSLSLPCCVVIINIPSSWADI